MAECVVMSFEAFPLTIAWESTLSCNLRCRQCASAAGAPRPRELSVDEALAICNQLPGLHVAEVELTGGEPLCHHGWEVIAARLRELRIRTKLLTNGVLLGAVTARRLSDAGIARVGVSIDGLDTTHDRIRGRRGLFWHVVAGIEELLKHGIPVTAISTINAANVGELPQLQQLLEAFGVDTWQLQPILPLGRAQELPDVSLSDDACLRLGAFVRDHPTGADARPVPLPGHGFGCFTELDQRRPAWGGCPAGIARCGITSDGRVKGCLSMPDQLVEGDLRERDLRDIWFDADSFRYNRRFTPENLGPSCRSCDRARECRGGCASTSYGSTRRLHDDPCCSYGILARRRRAAAPATVP